jgi:CRISPR type III-associated protein (TIGR04423 family)
MSKYYNKISTDEIPTDVLFEGYYWYSNASKPVILNGESLDSLSIFNDLPFVVEANFYSKQEKMSIQVKNIDGTYHIAKIDLNLPNDFVKEENFYIPHDIKITGMQKYKMVEAWEEVEDDLMEGMKVLVPSWTAFSGFCNE